ncbi:MAG TPA: alpha/beta fold hydrolase [Anaerolineales bacterium]|jgi:pimeloyl-ACP methyl ester carboxylesterase
MRKVIGTLVISLVFLSKALPAAAQGSSATIQVLDRNGGSITSLTDGNRVQLTVRLPAPAEAETAAVFLLDGMDAPVAGCSVAAGKDSCSSDPFNALGWYWGAGGQTKPERSLQVRLGGQQNPAELKVEVRPRPVVMVHGFLSSWETWKAYLGPQGYLASAGLSGFAVGDGQAPGVMNTGSPDNPASRTNSIAQNAQILKDYITGVQQKTGAEKVDLLVHSMGGMISRYYLDRVMDNDNVAQVIFLGTPMSGSACVFPVASLGFLMPASLEILPDYMNNIFNRQIIHRHGVPFYMVAGTLLIDPLTSPCADAPSDTVVGLDSATSIQLDDILQIPMFHGSLTTEKVVFDNDVLHLLQNPPGSFEARPDPEAAAVTSAPAQFSRAYTGHLNPGQSQEIIINIDPNVSLANFSLYDSSRSLDIEVHGANGNVITLDLQKNGLIRIDNPASMLYLGYGFKQPKAGKWVVKLITNAQTPLAGADYSINARFIGGATLSASSDPTIPAPGQPVKINARLQVSGAGLSVGSAEARIRKPDGSQDVLALAANGDEHRGEYQPDKPGLYEVEVVLAGKNADGFGVDRAAYLAFEVQPEKTEITNSRWLVLAAVLAVLAALAGLIWLAGRRRGQKTG